MRQPQQFTPHGEYSVRIEGRLLISELDGNWNREMQQLSLMRSAPLAQHLNRHGAWGSIVIITQSLAAPLEVLALGRQSVIDNPDASHMAGLAWVIAPEVEGYKLLLPAYRDMFAGLLDTEIFDNLATARDWITARIAASDPTT